MSAVPQRACPPEWPKNNVIVLILGVRSHSNLWNVFDKTYKDRVKKESAWEEIKQELNEEGNNYTIEELKKKWNILRTQYRKEQKLVINSKKSGSGTNDLYVPKFAYFEDLQFLNDGEIQRDSITSMDHDKENNSVSANDYSGKKGTSFRKFTQLN